MDADRFDQIVRFLTNLVSRRTLVGVTIAGALPPLMAQSDAVAKKRRKNKGKKGKKRGCTPKCAGKECGDDGCGRLCGTCDDTQVCQNGSCACASGHDACGDECCGECQECFATRPICVVAPGSDGASCSGGECCGGACCPPSCQCGVPGPIQAIDDRIAEYYKLPTPSCNALGTGQECGPEVPCPAGTECIEFTFEPMGPVGLCVGLCPDVSYPAF